MDQDDMLSFFLIKAQDADPLIHIADGSQNIRIIHAGIGTDRAVLHAKPADKSDIGCMTYTPTHSGRHQILHSQHCRIRDLAASKIKVFLLKRIIKCCRKGRTCMGMGSGNEYCIL